MSMYTANLCLIATAKYTRYVVPMLDSACNFFAVDHQPAFHVFTDADQPTTDRWPEQLHLHPEHGPRLTIHAVQHEPWPGPTLHRYRTMLTAADSFRDRTHTFYADVDMRFVAPVCDEIFGELTATQHPELVGMSGAKLPFEERMESTAFTGWRHRRRYCCGGFQGGRTETWIAAMREMDAAIAQDESRGLVARNHDESHWNHYLAEHPPTVTLSSQYCTPETWPTPGRKLLALDKNHAWMRAEGVA